MNAVVTDDRVVGVAPEPDTDAVTAEARNRLVVVVVLEHVVVAHDRQRLRRVAGAVDARRVLLVEVVGPVDLEVRDRRVRGVHLDVAGHDRRLAGIPGERDPACSGAVVPDLVPGRDAAVASAAQAPRLSGRERAIELRQRRERPAEAPVPGRVGAGRRGEQIAMHGRARRSGRGGDEVAAEQQGLPRSVALALARMVGLRRARDVRTHGPSVRAAPALAVSVVTTMELAGCGETMVMVRCLVMRQCCRRGGEGETADREESGDPGFHATGIGPRTGSGRTQSLSVDERWDGYAVRSYRSRGLKTVGMGRMRPPAYASAHSPRRVCAFRGPASERGFRARFSAARRAALSGLPGQQPVEPAGQSAPGGVGLVDPDPEHRLEQPAPPRLRVGPLGRRSRRDSDQHRLRQDPTPAGQSWIPPTAVSPTVGRRLCRSTSGCRAETS